MSGQLASQRTQRTAEYAKKNLIIPLRSLRFFAFSASKKIFVSFVVHCVLSAPCLEHKEHNGAQRAKEIPLIFLISIYIPLP